jgi:hypothetical protein
MSNPQEKFANLVIAAGDDAPTVVSRVLDHREWLDSSSVTVALTSRSLLELPSAPGPVVVEVLRCRGVRSRITVPPETTVGSWLRVRRTDWRAIELPNPAGRLDRVWLPASIADAPVLVAVNDLPARAESREPISIGIWAKLAHPRQRSGARMSDARDGLTAEIASAVKPALILLFSHWRGFRLVVGSDDQVAAELAGLAIQQLTSEPGGERSGPWENPLVQHTTELKVGIDHPGQIAATALWTGDSGTSAAHAFTAFASDVLARIGVKSDG